MSRNLTLRILSALVMIPVAVGAIYAGGWIFNLFAVALFVLSCVEWEAISRRFTPRPLYLLAGFLYFAISMGLFIMLRSSENGLYLTITLMLVVWASDTVAYIFGRSIGGPKLAPKISPNKTWAGLIGSVVGAGGVFYLMILQAHALVGIIDNTISMTEGVLFFLLAGAVLGVVGQVGDLLESHMKRKAGVKDSGRLIPGHGGILDRIDALLLVIPAFAIFCFYGL